MKRREFLRMVDDYRARHGFLPGVLAVPTKDTSALVELMEESYLPSVCDGLVKRVLTEGPESLAGRKIDGLVLEFDDELQDFELRRSSGNVMALKPQDMRNVYRPSADIVNSMKSIVSAAFAFFDESEEDVREALVTFAKKLAQYQNMSGDWETEGLPMLETVMLELEGSSFEAYLQFLERFFMACQDFHWHCKRLTPDDSEAVKPEEMYERMRTGMLVRGLPSAMRKEIMDELAVSGPFPDFAQKKKEE